MSKSPEFSSSESEPVDPEKEYFERVKKYHEGLSDDDLREGIKYLKERNAELKNQIEKAEVGPTAGLESFLRADTEELRIAEEELSRREDKKEK